MSRWAGGSAVTPSMKVWSEWSVQPRARKSWTTPSCGSGIHASSGSSAAAATNAPGSLREPERATRAAQVERLDAHPVARQQQPLPIGIPKREREHPVEARDGVRTPAGVRGQDDLGVRPGGDLLAQVAQLRRELEVVVDLPVVDEDGPAPAHRLRPRVGRIEDAQPQVAQDDPVVDVDPRPVGTPVAEGAHHPLDRRGIHRPAVEPDDARYAAHAGIVLEASGAMR